jgi:hypothetical protein
MVGQLRAGESGGETLRVERHHRRILFLRLRDEPVINVLVSLLQVGPLHGILYDMEQERVSRIFKYFQSPSRATCCSAYLYRQYSLREYGIRAE